MAFSKGVENFPEISLTGLLCLLQQQADLAWPRPALGWVSLAAAPLRRPGHRKFLQEAFKHLILNI